MTKRKLDESAVLTGFMWGALLGALIAFVRLPTAWVRFRQGLLKAEERKRLLRRVDPVTASLDEGRVLAARRRRGQTAATDDQVLSAPP